jgi:pimeloyl-ACP methyl ester carboxylesterase
MNTTSGPAGRLAYQDQGAGAECVVLIAGVMCDHSVWAGTATQLAQRYRVISLDNRDIGGSAACESPYLASHMAGDVLAVMDAAAVPRAHVIGHSLGGLVAQALALDAPKRVNRLVLCNTLARHDTYSRSVFALWQQWRAAAAAGDTDADYERFVQAVCFTVFGTPLLAAVSVQDLAAGFIQGVARQSDAAFERNLHALMHSERADELGRIGAPTLVVAGNDDRIFPPHHANALVDAITGSRLALIAGAGHNTAIECPDAFHAAVEAFLAER